MFSNVNWGGDLGANTEKYSHTLANYLLQMFSLVMQCNLDTEAIHVMVHQWQNKDRCISYAHLE